MFLLLILIGIIMLSRGVSLYAITVSRLEAGEPAMQLRTLMATLSALGLESRHSPAQQRQRR